jgi:putative transposase
MKKTRFTETQIVAILRKQEAGVAVKDICREHGISDATFYNWKAKYGGMEVSDVKKAKDMEAELSQYKKMYAEVSFQLEAAKALIAKKF